MSLSSYQSILILGAGREGRATAAYLQATALHARLTLADQQPMTNDLIGVNYLTGVDYPTDLSHWDLVIVSPGIPPQTPLLQTARQITTATNIFFEDCRGTIIAVTGSKGKSTTSSLIAHILTSTTPTHLVGNIGRPGLETLLQHNHETDIYVYELSSYQASRLVQGPDIVVITSLFPEHLDYHGSLEQYYTDKLRVTRLQTADQHLFYNADNAELTKRISSSLAIKHPWPSADGIHLRGNTVCLPTGEVVLQSNDIPLLGAHNISNVMGAISVARIFNIPSTIIKQAVQTFQALPHRLERIGTFNDITFYNDSISTTPESALAALEAIPNVATIILGGSDRGYNFAQLASELQRLGIANVVLFPESGAVMKAELQKINYHPRLLETSSLTEAVAFAYQHTPVGSVCLLSPASPSYNLFKNFEDRGQQFRVAVRTYHSQ